MESDVTIFWRRLYDQMLRWKRRRRGRTALLIRGARRVGKSTLAKTFAKREYQSYILIDFTKVSEEITSLFDDLSDLDYIFLKLKLAYGVELYKRRSCIVFDEIQLCPKARQAIKQLVKDGRYDYIETGALLSIRENVKDIVVPSEETILDLLPIDYEEFRRALGDDVTIRQLKIAFDLQRPLSEGINRKLMRDFRIYMLVGGMPQAVDKYLESNSLPAVDEVKREIIQLYEDDFKRIDPTGVASQLFDAIPAQLNSNAKRYQIGKVIAGAHRDRMREIIAKMNASMTVVPAYHANDPNAGHHTNKNVDFYKLFLPDTGLFVTLAFKDKDFTENTIYNKLLSDKPYANLGYVYENAVAQMLLASGNELLYHTWRMDSGNRNYEIDFILQRGEKICPITVKSSSYKTHASLNAFDKKYSDKIGQKYVLYTKDLCKNGQITYLPMYMAQFL